MPFVIVMIFSAEVLGIALGVRHLHGTPTVEFVQVLETPLHVRRLEGGHAMSVLGAFALKLVGLREAAAHSSGAAQYLGVVAELVLTVSPAALAVAVGTARAHPHAKRMSEQEANRLYSLQ